MKVVSLLLVGCLLASVALAEESGLPPPVDSSAGSVDMATPDPLNPLPSLGNEQAATPDPLLEDALKAPPTVEAQTEPVTAETPAAYSDNLSAPSTGDMIDEQMAKEEKQSDLEKRRLVSELIQHEGGKYHVGLNFAFHAFDDFDFDPSSSVKSLSTNGALLEFLYFPLTYGWGRLGMGPVIGVYSTNHAIAYSGLHPSFLTYGAEIQYEFLYSVGQTLVPFLIGGYEGVTLGSYIYQDGTSIPDTSSVATPNTASTASQKFSRGYYGGGVAISLNRLEHRTASRALADTGIRKFYLVLTWKSPLSNGTKGNGLLGLRFEF
jgi:hypothetical protein